jgi:quercetin dioxygenase-like cupin family protein
MKIIRSGSLPSIQGPEAWFTGTVRIDAPFQATEPAKVGGATVTFEPGHALPGIPILLDKR